MKFRISAESRFPRELVFETMRDRMDDLAEYLPNIDSVQTLERKVDGDVIRLTKRWTGVDTDFPSVVRPFIKTEYLQWTDHVVYDRSRWRNDWQLELGVLPDAIDGSGYNLFQEDMGGTVIEMHGDFKVDAAKLPGVPSMLQSKVGPALEKFIVGLLQPNMLDTYRGLEEYLLDQGYDY